MCRTYFIYNHVIFKVEVLISSMLSYEELIFWTSKPMQIFEQMQSFTIILRYDLFFQQAYNVVMVMAYMKIMENTKVTAG